MKATEVLLVVARVLVLTGCIAAGVTGGLVFYDRVLSKRDDGLPVQ